MGWSGSKAALCILISLGVPSASGQSFSNIQLASTDWFILKVPASLSPSGFLLKKNKHALYLLNEFDFLISSNIYKGFKFYPEAYIDGDQQNEIMILVYILIVVEITSLKGCACFKSFNKACSSK